MGRNPGKVLERIHTDLGIWARILLHGGCAAPRAAVSPSTASRGGSQRGSRGVLGVLGRSWERFGSLVGSFEVLLAVSWGSLGRPLESLRRLFGDLWGLQIEHRRMTRIECMSLGALDVFC